jgi:LytS/YehU family sensor histidine kinase
MIGQPFIENAVEHGMRKIETGGLIGVFYELIDGRLRVQIVDNGYGIDTGNTHNKRHQSMAIEITRERIEIMNKKQKLCTSFDTQDAFPADDERKGVCVTFIFPLVSAV